MWLCHVDFDFDTIFCKITRTKCGLCCVNIYFRVFFFCLKQIHWLCRARHGIELLPTLRSYYICCTQMHAVSLLVVHNTYIFIFCSNCLFNFRLKNIISLPSFKVFHTHSYLGNSSVLNAANLRKPGKTQCDFIHLVWL